MLSLLIYITGYGYLASCCWRHNSRWHLHLHLCCVVYNISYWRLRSGSFHSSDPWNSVLQCWCLSYNEQPCIIDMSVCYVFFERYRYSERAKWHSCLHWLRRCLSATPVCKFPANSSSFKDCSISNTVNSDADISASGGSDGEADED